MADFARGDRFRELRNARHLSQEDAAHEIGVSVKSLRSWEHDGGIKWDHAKSAGTFYSVEPESLVTRSRDELREQLDRIEQHVALLVEALVPESAVPTEVVGPPDSRREDDRVERGVDAT